MDENTKKLACFTIGHSTHKAQRFIGLLKLHSIQYVIDVRSIPYSRYNPQYNRELIKPELEKHKISYIFMGNLLGAKYNDPVLFFSDKPVVDFNKVCKLNSFTEGINRIMADLGEGHRITLMCSEKDPFKCHRFGLISHILSKKGVSVKHILDNGDIISNEILEEKLISKYKLDSKQPTLFESVQSKSDIIEEGYILRNKDLGYLKKEIATS